MYLSTQRKFWRFLRYIVVCYILLIGLIQVAEAKQRPINEDVRDQTFQARSTNSSKLLLTPDYDSGWKSVGEHDTHPVEMVLNHNLGGDENDYWLNLQCWDETLGVYDCIDNDFLHNAYWRDLTDHTVTVRVIKGIRPDQVRLRIFTETPHFDSDWIDLANHPDTMNVPINIGTIGGLQHFDLTCYDEAHNNMYACTGLENGSFIDVAYWFDHDPGSSGSPIVQVKVLGGPEPTHIRLRIYLMELTGFAGYYQILQGSGTIKFSTADFFPWLPEHYLVDLRCGYLESSHNQIFSSCRDSSFDVVGTWFNLRDTGVSINAQRNSAEDVYLSVAFYAQYPKFLPLFLK